MGTMKNLLIATALSALTYGAHADAIYSVIVAERGEQVTYIAGASKLDDGSVILNPNQIFVGEKILKNESGSCIKETSTLNGFSKFEFEEVEINKPNISIRSEAIACPVIEVTK